jgi:uncharacterized protein (UPF0548 family)
MSQKQSKEEKNIESPQSGSPRSASNHPLLDHALDPVKRFEQLISHWYQMAIAPRVDELQIQETVGEPFGATGFSPGGQPLDSLDLGLDASGNEAIGRAAEPEEERPWRWSLVWLSILGVFGGLGTAALVWLTALPPLPNCQQVSRLTSDGEVLYCAQQAAQTGQLSKIVSSVELLKQWDNEHPLHGEASRLIDEWSARILVNARIKMQQDDAKGAMEAIKHIPKTSKVYGEGQEIVQEWRQQWQKGKDLYAKAQDAMKNQKWDDVSVHILALSKFDNEYWSTRQTNALAQQLGVERQARQTLIRAQKLAKSGSFKGMGEAMTLAQKVTPKTYAANDAKVNLSQWSKTLLTAGVKQWTTGDRGGAITTLYVPPAPNTAPEVQDLVRFGNAYMMVNSTYSNWVPSGNQIWNLMEAIAAMKQVKSDSPFYEQAQAHLKDWQTSLKDVVQLKYSSLTAGMGQHSALKLAISQAKQVPAGHPRRIQAQTLIAYWGQEVERIEDEPYLVRARALAKSGEVPDLKAAMAQASHIRLGRSMRGQAQDWIATWRSQIEVIEDQPILTLAKALGADGKLDDAINTASKIKEGRALYTEAQSVIWNWRAEQIRIAQIAQDQPILDHARALAANGNLSAAIDVAYQIGYGRALYYEAQGSIGAWQEQLRPPAPPVVEEAPRDNGTAYNDDSDSAPVDELAPIEGGNSYDSGYNGDYGGSSDGSSGYDSRGYDSRGYDSRDSRDSRYDSRDDGYAAPAAEYPAPAEYSAPAAEPAPAEEVPPVIDTMPMEEIVPSSNIEAPPPVYEAPQSFEPVTPTQASLPEGKSGGKSGK